MQSHLRWLVLAILSSALLLIVIDVTVLYLALPSLTHDLHASAAEKLWIVNAYALTVAGLLPGMGALGDRFGHKRFFVMGLVVFGGASLLAAFSPNPVILIAARVILAVGAAMMMPATLAIIRHTFEDPRERSIAIGVWAAIASGGAALGPVVGGVLLEYFWWGSVFLINLPIVLIALVLAVAVIPQRDGNPNRPFDLVASVQIMIALVGMTFAIKEVSKADPSLMLAVAAVIISLIAGAAYVRRQRWSKAPMLDFTLFRSRVFTAGVIAALIASAALMGMELAVSQRMQLVADLSPLQAGIALLPIPLAAFVAGPLTGFVLPRLGTERVLWSSLALSAVGILTYLFGYQSGVLIQIAAFTTIGVGIGAAMTAASSAILLNAPADKAGMVASIEEVSYELGGAFGIAILGSLLSAVYSTSFQVPVGAAMPETARDSIDGALLAAETLPEDLASALVNQAQGAFDSAFMVVLTVAVVMLIAAAIGIAALAQRVRVNQ
ncbi:MFS transporter [Phyllobacterium phragmitis]|uniref:MFS transporter n=1 Tax=Phyllobacterium phragmitis TaxID=2670329 RepID=A0A2S9IJ52_9HYPH|nr:MFS transporter [Phyllobacterium phragmitis]PRD40545.1 MFS transporter [Phyllobacterium phragmitis]